MSGRKEWPELVGQTFQQASQAILAFDSRMNNFLFRTDLYIFFVIDLHPYNARNGIENYMFDPLRVSCVTNNNDIVTQPPSYNYPN